MPTTLRESNVAVEKPLFIDDFPIETPVLNGFPSLPRLMRPEGRSNMHVTDNWHPLKPFQTTSVLSVSSVNAWDSEPSEECGARLCTPRVKQQAARGLVRCVAEILLGRAGNSNML